MSIELPSVLASFIANGGTTIPSEDGDWDLIILAAEDSDFREFISKDAVVIAENGCGDCLFLKKAKSALGKKVFVFLHEEDRTEIFAPDIAVILSAPAPKTPPPKPAPPPKPVSLADLEKVVMDPQRGTYRSTVLERFKQGPFGVEALPLLRRILEIDDIFLVLHAAECIAKLGPRVKASDDYDELQRQLNVLGSKVWDYSGYANAFGDCLEALHKIEADELLLLTYIHHNIGIEGPDDFISAMRVLATIDRKDAKDLLRRAALFRQSDLNLRQRKQMDAILKSAGLAGS